MEWEKSLRDDWWYVYDVCFITKEEDGYYEVGRWGQRSGRLPEMYPTLEAAKLAAELIFG